MYSDQLIGGAIIKEAQKSNQESKRPEGTRVNDAFVMRQIALVSSHNSRLGSRPEAGIRKNDLNGQGPAIIQPARSARGTVSKTLLDKTVGEIRSQNRTTLIQERTSKRSGIFGRSRSPRQNDTKPEMLRAERFVPTSRDGQRVRKRQSPDRSNRMRGWSSEEEEAAAPVKKSGNAILTPKPEFRGTSPPRKMGRPSTTEPPRSTFGQAILQATNRSKKSGAILLERAASPPTVILKRANDIPILRRAPPRERDQDDNRLNNDNNQLSPNGEGRDKLSRLQRETEREKQLTSRLISERNDINIQYQRIYNTSRDREQLEKERSQVEDRARERSRQLVVLKRQSPKLKILESQSPERERTSKKKVVRISSKSKKTNNQVTVAPKKKKSPSPPPVRKVEKRSKKKVISESSSSSSNSSSDDDRTLGKKKSMLKAKLGELKKKAPRKKK